MSMASAIKAAQEASAASPNQPQAQEDVVTSSTVKIKKLEIQLTSGQKWHCQPHGIRSLGRRLRGQVWDHGIIAEFKDGHVSSVRGRQKLRVKPQEFRCFI